MNQSGRISEWYFRPKTFELGGRLHVWLGVGLFKKGLMGLAKPAPGSKESGYWMASRDEEGLLAFERRTRRNEIVHLLVLLPAIVGLIFAGAGYPLLFAVLFLIIALNFYLILLQRYNRIRLLRTLARQLAKRAAQESALR